MTGLVWAVIGIDPGPVPGIVLLRDSGIALTHNVVQCDQDAAPHILHALLDLEPGPVVVQIEQFVVGRRAGRLSTPAAAAATRDLIGRLRETWEDHDATSTGRRGGRWYQRGAAHVKPWATDQRLEAAGLLETTQGMRHARDAARHALYAACHDAGVPDPLRKRSR